MSRSVRALVLTVVLGSSVLLPGAALGGCLSEYNSCRNCALAKLMRSIKNIDFWGIIEAQSDATDCQIDLYHCILLGQHHDSSSCSV